MYGFLVLSSRTRARAPDFTGGNPAKVYRSAGMPDRAKAAVTEQGPGTIQTGIPASRHAATVREPGSDIPGIPESETSARDSPLSTRSRIVLNRDASLNLWQLSNGVFKA